MKLHLGCGAKYIPGFVHVDAIQFEHIDHVSSIDRLTFIESESVDLIYNCHVLEHFKRASVRDVLKEWCRVLKPGGILRTAVPDFEAICQVYSQNKDLSKVIGPIMGGQNYLYNIHYNVFDFATLKGLLEDTGFQDIQRWDWRKTEHAHIDDYSQSYLPHMQKETGTLMSLNVEGVKI